MDVPTPLPDSHRLTKENLMQAITTAVSGLKRVGHDAALLPFAAFAALTLASRAAAEDDVDVVSPLAINQAGAEAALGSVLGGEEGVEGAMGTLQSWVVWGSAAAGLFFFALAVAKGYNVSKEGERGQGKMSEAVGMGLFGAALISVAAIAGFFPAALGFGGGE